MARVPVKEYNARLPSVNVTPRNLGADTNAQMRLGGAINEFAGALDRIAYDNFQTRLAEHQIAINDKFNELGADYLNRKGGETLEAMNEYVASYDDVKNSLLDNIDNGDMKNEVGRIFDEKSSLFKGKLAMHMVNEKKAYQNTLLVNLSDSAQKSVSDSLNPDEIALAASEVVALYTTHNQGRTEDEYKRFLNATVDKFYITHAGAMQERDPGKYLKYYEANKEILEDRVTAEAGEKLANFYNVAKNQDRLNKKKANAELTNKVEVDLKLQAKNAKTLSEVERIREDADRAYSDGEGPLRPGARVAIETTLNSVRDKLEKDVRLRDIFSGHEVNFKPGEMRQAVDLRYEDVVSQFTPETSPQERQAKIAEVVTAKGMMPTALGQRFLTAATSANVEDTAELLNIFERMKKDAPNVLSETHLDRIHDIKAAAYWTSLSSRTAARSRMSGQIDKNTLAEDMKYISDNVYKIDDFKRKELIKDFRKKITSTDSNHERATGDLRRLFSAVELDVNSKGMSWGIGKALQTVGFNVIDKNDLPKTAVSDFLSLTEQAYVHNGGNYEDAVEAAKIAYTPILKAYFTKRKEGRVNE